MSDELRPLPCHPWPVAPEHLALMKRAKAELDLPYQIVPVEAVPGSPGRVLALGSRPPQCSDVVMVAPAFVGVYEAIREAMRHALTVPAGALVFFEDADYLAALLGAREITSPLELQALADLQEERAMRAAMTG